MVIIQVIVIRSLDSQGRITLPRPIREKLDIQPQDSFFITCENNAIVMKKQSNEPGSPVFSSDGIGRFSGQIVLSREEAREILTELKNRR